MISVNELKEYSLILYDGDCGLCNHSVAYLIQHDTIEQFHFLPLQSPTAHAYLKEMGLEEIHYDTMYFSDRGKIYDRSTAALLIAQRLPQRKHQILSWILRILPISLRDYGYDIISRNRHHLVKTPKCILPTPETEKRFLSE